MHFKLQISMVTKYFYLKKFRHFFESFDLTKNNNLIIADFVFQKEQTASRRKTPEHIRSGAETFSDILKMVILRIIAIFFQFCLANEMFEEQDFVNLKSPRLSRSSGSKTCCPKLTGNVLTFA